MPGMAERPDILARGARPRSGNIEMIETIESLRGEISQSYDKNAFPLEFVVVERPDAAAPTRSPVPARPIGLLARADPNRNHGSWDVAPDPSHRRLG